MTPDREALSPREAALYISISDSTFARMKRDGRLPKPVYVTPRRPRWTKEVLRNWLREIGEESPNTALGAA